MKIVDSILLVLMIQGIGKRHLVLNSNYGNTRYVSNLDVRETIVSQIQWHIMLLNETVAL